MSFVLESGMRTKAKILKAIMNKVTIQGSCWEWQGIITLLKRMAIDIAGHVRMKGDVRNNELGNRYFIR